MKPEYKLLITYDILPDKQDSYYRYVLGEFVPALRTMGVHMTSAWHTAYGKYPARLLEFTIESHDIWRRARNSVRWNKLEDRLQTFTTAYQRKLIRYRDAFQF
ncbi:MAG: hypothetical protein IPM16_20885 [Chloroflexi bacterium]|nr:hypothetical protein [Chloroflexota bacterium]